MIIGIECTAHTFGVGVVRNGKILSNVKDMFMTETGGIIPVKAAEHHRLVAEQVWNDALDKAGISEDKIDAIALSNAPGLSPCLLAGMNFAKHKAEKLGLKIIPVNHCIAHLEIGRREGAKDPVLLYTSGANTQIIAYEAGKYRVFGETLDVGIGNFLDKVARNAGLGFPGGPKLEKEAVGGKYIEMPYTIKGMDVAFSGLVTKADQLLKKGNSLKDVSFSIQETTFAMLVEAAERALAHTGKKELVLGGGVACNSRLQEMCRIMCKERKAKFFCPEKNLLTDNGAMIAYTGELMTKKNYNEVLVDYKKININPRERTDEVFVSWRGVMKSNKILIMGLPGSGKTTLAKELSLLLNAVHFNADDIRKNINKDLGFSNKDRIEQAKRMGWLCDCVAKNGSYVIADFVCPTDKTRKAFGKCFLVFLDTIKKSRYKDTNKLFSIPKSVDFLVKRKSAKFYAKEIQNILDKKRLKI